VESTVRNIIARRDLLAALTRSEVKTAAAESQLGWVWWLLDPLLMIGVYWIFIVILLGSDRYVPYPVFVGCALLPWKHLAASLNGGVAALRAREGLIRAVPFPTMVIPLALVVSQGVYFVCGLAVLLVVSLLFGQTLGPTLLQVPMLVLLQGLIVAGLCLPLSCLAVVYRDIRNVVAHALRVGWYLSPGIYGTDVLIDRVGAGSPLVAIYMLNPFAILFEGYRGALFEPAWLPASHWAVLAIEAAAILALGHAVYRRYDRRVIKFL
jgi:ABC-type polysaccharide/polyol phosphate export permease